MMKVHSPATVYTENINKHQAYLQKLLRKRKNLGWIRLLIFISTLIMGWQIFVTAGLIGIPVLVVGIAILLYFVFADVNNNQKISNTKTLIAINKEELQVLNHHYSTRFDGNNYMPAEHNYANDLDLFGKSSIYQWSHRCYTEQGRNLLAENLLRGLTLPEIRARQEAIKELAPDVEWRQQLQSLTILTTITTATEEKTETWLREEKEYFSHPSWKVFVMVYSIISISTAAVATLGFMHLSIFTFLYLFYFSFSIFLSRNTIKPYVHLSGIVKEVNTLYQVMEWIEEKKFQSPLLQQLQQQGKPANENASAQVKELKNILDRFDLRLNIAGLLFFNSFLLWDVRQMIALNTWRQKNKTLAKKWFETIAEMEVLHSLATIHFNHPEWYLPEFSEAYFTFEAKELGHPLIPESHRIDSDFYINGTGKIGLVTGSNMAGKSTFLRSIGVNIVLAQIGAPCCAKTLLLSPVRLMSSMRIADNLAENTSTFYAELKKLKTIIESVNQHESVFILLDEILRGTNSFDRHTGSEALIRQLIKQKTVAVIATHDLELAKLEEEFPGSLENYHFDVQVIGEELEFDYKLKHGICKSMNASILMKKIGIEL